MKNTTYTTWNGNTIVIENIDYIGRIISDANNGISYTYYLIHLKSGKEIMVSLGSEKHENHFEIISRCRKYLVELLSH